MNVEKVQKRFTRKLYTRIKPQVPVPSYSNRLIEFNIHSLEDRYIYFDLITLFRIINGNISVLLRFSATLVPCTVLCTLHLLGTTYLFVSMVPTKARPCTGRTLYKWLHEDLNLGKHTKSSRLVHFSRAVFFLFLFLVLLRSYDQVLKHRLHCGEYTQATYLLLSSLDHNDYSNKY